MESYLTHSQEETQRIAAMFSNRLVPGDVVALEGDLGAGKTTFTQGLVAALGSLARVKSPTFTVAHEYPIEGNSRIRRIVHSDFYRFSSAEELRELELESYHDGATIFLGEWPERVGGVLPGETYRVFFKHQGGDTRLLTIISHAQEETSLNQQ